MSPARDGAVAEGLPARRGWWRLNRWWLPVLPLALVLAVGASSYRVRTFWWESGLHRAVATAEPGRTVRVVDRFEDSLGPTSRTFSVRLDGLRRVDRVPTSLSGSRAVPPGASAWRVGLSWRARPDQDLTLCTVLVVDRDGARYGGDSSDPLGQVTPCVPEGHPGPSSPLVKGDRRGQVRPGEQRPVSWTVHPVVLAAEDARPAQVWVTFRATDYVVLPVR